MIEFTREFCELNGINGVMAKYSRLLVDVNRPLSSPTLFRTECDGIEVDLNKNMDEIEKKQRIKMCYESYHKELSDMVKLVKPELLISIHGFDCKINFLFYIRYTDCYEGSKREVEIGVLFNKDDSIAKPLNDHFRSAGYDSRLNEPWSGKDGYMFSVETAASLIDAKCIMIEFRQDLLTKSNWRANVATQLQSFLQKAKYL